MGGVELNLSSSLEIYVDYEWLVAEQLATVITGVSRAYASILEQKTETFPWLIRRPFGVRLIDRVDPLGYPPLGVDRVETAQSISLSFGPTFAIRASHTGIDIGLPKWTAAIVLVGSALTYGMDRYEQFLHVSNLRLEHQKLEYEIQQLIPPSPTIRRRVEYQVRQVSDALAYPNIRSSTINGVPLRR
jgi:hypothetical protein